MQKPGTFTRSLLSGAMAGFWGGQLFLAIGLLRYSDELFTPSHPGFLTPWILVRSVALYGLLGAVVGVMCAAVFHLPLRRLGRAQDMMFPAVFSLAVVGTTAAYLTAWRQLEVYVGLPFDYPGRIRSFALDSLSALVVGAALLGLLIWVRKSLADRGRLDMSARPAVAVLLVAAGALLASNYALRLRAPLEEAPAGRRPLLVFGVDAGTLRVMGPMIRAGELPTFARLAEEGAWGTFLAYGPAFSPVQWTSMATGKKVEDHGIYDFVAPKEGTSEARLLTSRDRRVEAVWHMLGEHGFRVGVLDWLMTYPPEEVNGYMVTRLQTRGGARSYPEALDAAVEDVIADREDFGDPVRDRLLGEIDRLFKLANKLEQVDPVDVMLMFEATTDEAQHNFWKHFSPGDFDPESWKIRPQEVERFGSVIPELYRLIDQRLGELLENLSPNTLVLIVSDHGQRASLGAPVWFGVDHILAAMDMLEFSGSTEGDHEEESSPEVTRSGQQIDFENTRAYSALAVVGSPVMGIKLNLEGREPAGTVSRQEADGLIEDLAERLRGIAFENGDPLFGRVSTVAISDEADNPGRVDISVQHSEFTRGAGARDAARAGRKIVIDGHAQPLSDFIATDQGVSGRHEREGIIFVAGKGVRRGYIGQTVATTAVQALFRQITDRLSVADMAHPVLRKLGMVDRATTLDVTPTVLYALGVPVGEDMAGRPLTDVITGPTPSWIASYDDPNRVRTPVGDEEADEEVLKRLRALGYIR